MEKLRAEQQHKQEKRKIVRTDVQIETVIKNTCNLQIALQSFKTLFMTFTASSFKYSKSIGDIPLKINNDRK